MKSNLIRLLSLVLVILVTVSLFYGCGSKETDTSSNNTATNSSKAGETSNPAVSEEKKPEDYTGKVSFWFWDGSIVDRVTSAFNETYPNIELEMVTMSADDYLKKFQVSLAADSDLPDAGPQERFVRGMLYSLNGAWEDLSKEPYNLKEEDFFQFAIDLSKDPEGRIFGVPWDGGIEGLAYKRDLAEKYFGTSDRAELEKLFPTWGSLIEKGEEIKSENGNVYLFPSLEDVFQISAYQSNKRIVQDNAIMLTDVWSDTFDVVYQMNKFKLADKNTMWSPGWNAAMASENYIFAAMPAWGPQYIIEANDPEGKGNWGLMTPPEGISEWGGNSIGLVSKSENKEAAWEFIKWFLMSPEGISVNKEFGKILYYKEAHEESEYYKMDSPWFAPQDIGEIYFKEFAPKLDLRPISKYDSELFNTAKLTMQAMSQDISITPEGALEFMVKELKNKLPNAEIK